MGFFSKLFGKKDKAEKKCECGCEGKKAKPAATAPSVPDNCVSRNHS